ncbi:MAG: glycine cleavage system aminomethyltransferase GcvT [Calditrichaeota bacterium]|nr:glycine cleavage system aminomethyltransferase GcvT [Calditrichota bacterium]
MNHVALESQHAALGGKMVPFAGFIMPVQYSSIIEEHLAVRKNVGMFDVSHMGEFIVKGPKAEAWLNKMTTNNVSALEIGQVQYSSMLYDHGGVVDDLLVYRLENHFMTVVNASNIDKDFDWLHSHLESGVELTNISDDMTLLAIQGPKAEELVQKFADRDLKEIAYYNFNAGHIKGARAVFSRTGYTGEDGFEIYVYRKDSEILWNAVWKAGKPLGLKPIGLGARDSLRLEACLSLYGNDIDQSTNPIEANLGWIVKTKKPGGFIGLDEVLKVKANQTRRLMGFVLTEKGIARHGQEVFIEDRKVGYVTSGGYSPILDKAVGLAYIDKPLDVVGTKIAIDVRGRRIAAEIVEMPFYKRSA